MQRCKPIAGENSAAVPGLVRRKLHVHTTMMRRSPLPILALVLACAVPASSHDDMRPIRFLARAGRVNKGTEKQTCFPVTFPRNRSIDVNHVQMFVHGGSHHVHLYRPASADVEYPNADKTYSPAGPGNKKPRDCAFAIDFSHWELVTATQNHSLDWKLHPGVAINFTPHQPLLIQTHFVNTQGLSVKGTAHAKLVLHPMHANAVTAYGGALFGQDKTVKVPPGLSTASSNCKLTGEASEKHAMTVMALTGHYHFRGVKFEIWKMDVNGNRVGDPVYSHDGYNDPEFRQYAPGELVLQPGEGLVWKCTWQNGTGNTYLFGPNTEKNEHCNLFGFYYPSTGPQEGIDCVHEEDGSDLRIINENG